MKIKIKYFHVLISFFLFKKKYGEYGIIIIFMKINKIMQKNRNIVKKIYKFKRLLKERIKLPL